MLPLRGRVGRHANTGVHCQNWKDDQEFVISLLNSIPPADGGTGGSLGGRVVAGIASDPLYRSILHFEKKYFGRQSGFVDPGGPMLAKLEALATRTHSPPEAPPPKGRWDDIKSRSILDGLRKALDDDHNLSHADAVDLIRGALSDGIITSDELDDLSTVATTSKTISPRSQKMLTMFVAEVRSKIAAKGPYSLATYKQQLAADRTCDFLKGSGAKSFPHLDRDEVGVGILMRIANPGILDQGQAGVCGAAAMLFNVANDNPGRYAAFAIDLYERGKAHIDGFDIAPGNDVRNYTIPAAALMSQVDWMTMASLRDSENWIYHFSSFDDKDGGTTADEEEKWFKRAGYSDVRNETNGVFSKDADNADEATRLFNDGYSVVLFIHANMLQADKQTNTSHGPNHVVVLQSPIDRSGGYVKFKVFTWGQRDYQVPQGAALSEADFLENYYGYVAGKP